MDLDTPQNNEWWIDDDEEGGGDRVPASEIQIRSVVLTRDTLAKWITEPFVDACAPGCYVRISVGVNRHTGENKYALGEIVGVAEGTHKAYNLKEYEYPHRGSGKWTNKWLLLRRAEMILEPIVDCTETTVPAQQRLMGSRQHLDLCCA